jgi:hypothetical protein
VPVGGFGLRGCGPDTPRRPRPLPPAGGLSPKPGSVTVSADQPATCRGPCAVLGCCSPKQRPRLPAPARWQRPVVQVRRPGKRSDTQILRERMGIRGVHWQVCTLMLREWQPRSALAARGKEAAARRAPALRRRPPVESQVSVGTTKASRVASRARLAARPRGLTYVHAVVPRVMRLARGALVVDIVRCVGVRHFWFLRSDDGIGFYPCSFLLAFSSELSFRVRVVPSLKQTSACFPPKELSLANLLLVRASYYELGMRRAG